MPTPLERQRWKTAQKRAQAKRNLTYYVVVNIILMIIWLKQQGWPPAFDNFWPGWVLFGWGIALFFSFRNVYGDRSDDLTKKEYEKLLKEEGQSGSGL
jgi:hypothetical protein